MKNKISKWEEPLCNICGSPSKKTIYTDLTYWEYPGKFQIVKCSRCGLTFTSPRPNISEMEKYYESKMYFGRDVASDYEIEDSANRELHYGPMYDLILTKKKYGSILDIGAGTGMLLSKFKDEGWEVDGVELTGSAVRYCKKKYGINLRKGDFLDKKINNKYDVVVLNGALEHLHKPLETLTKARSLLKNRGIIVVSIPNSASIGRKLFGRNWFAWQPPRHLYHFTPITVKTLFNKAGFKKINILFSYDVQNKYILFQSARYMLSPKFKKKKTGGLVNSEGAFKKTFSIKKEIGKVIFYVSSNILSLIEPLIKKSEVIIVYAEK